MAIGVKVLERPIEETSYVRATLKGMALTAKHLFDVNGRVTIQYPEEKSPISPRWRGTHRMLTTEDGKAKCVACGLCPTVCPANCIKLVPGEDEEGNRYPLVFEIDEFRCIFCGYCQEVCPGRGDPRRPPLRELGVQPRRLRLRPGASDGADASGVRDVGSRRPEGRVMQPHDSRSSTRSISISSGIIAVASALAVRHAQESRGGGALAREHDVQPRGAST